MTGALAGSIGSETICGELCFLAVAFGGGGGAEGRLAIRGIPVEDTTKVVLTLIGSSLANAGAGELTATFLAGRVLGAGKDFLTSGAVLTAILMAGFEPLAGAEIGAFLSTTTGTFFEAALFVGAFLATVSDFLAGEADFFAAVAVFLVGAIDFLTLTGR
jgi:hypothetical protein